MKNKIKIICLALAMAVMPVTGNVLADKHDETGPYAGMGFGKTQLDLGIKTANGNTANAEADTWSPSVFGGYMFHPNFGAEAGVAWFGTETKVRRTDNSHVNNESSAHAFYLAGLGKYQVADNVAAYAKAGIHRWAYDEESKDSSDAPNDTKLRLKGVDPMFGIGVQFDASEQTSFRLEWSRYMVKDKADGDKFDGDLDIFGVQMLYRL